MMMRKLIALALVASAGATVADDAYEAQKASVVDKNFVKVDRIERDEIQEFCSKPRAEQGDAAQMTAIREAALASVQYPADGVYLGDWESGYAIANNGKGLQYSDNPDEPNGGNCYACHKLDPREVAYGTIGPALTGYGNRGQSEPMLKYTWTKLWNTHAYNVCSHMPRFGDQGILTEQQLKDVMAYLLDPKSPVNIPVEE